MNESTRTLPRTDAVAFSLQGRDAPILGELKDFARRKLSSSLGRFSTRIGHVAVWLEDVNGPRGGVDKLCRLQVQLNPKGKIFVSTIAANEYLALARSAEKARTTMDRTSKQRRMKKRMGTPTSRAHTLLDETARPG